MSGIVGAGGRAPNSLPTPQNSANLRRTKRTKIRLILTRSKQGVVAAFFLSQIYWPWGLDAHRGWARRVLDRKCLIEVPNAPRHRAERAHAEADDDEETAFNKYANPEAGHRAGSGGPVDA